MSSVCERQGHGDMVNATDDDLDRQLLGQMLKDFLEESKDQLDTLNLDLTRLEETPGDSQLINEIFRITHTLKGTAAFVGLPETKALAHKMEDLFGAMRKGNLTATPSIIDVMFDGLRVLTVLLDKAAAGDPAEIDISGIVEQLGRALTDAPPTPESGMRSRASGEQPLQPDLVAAGVLNEAAPETTKTVPSGDTIRVSIEKLDRLMDLAGELITFRNRLAGFAGRFVHEEVEAISSGINHLTRELRDSVANIRMVPIERLFIKFPGVVRNLARERNKEVEFFLEGRQAELDKSLIEQIYDPFVHLLRNAVEHGIEAPEVREKKGKSRAGKIRLSARRRQNSMIVEVADDGRGIDPGRVKKVALQRGIISESDAEELTDAQAVQLIFAPGFSTTEQVNDTSGRGVGMDVVRENIRNLRGVVEVDSTVGEGTIFRITLPLTLAIVQVLLVKTEGLTYALPLDSVRETIRIDPTQISSVDRGRVVVIRGVAHPIRRLSSMLGLGGKKSASPCKISDRCTFVIVGVADKHIALWVEELLGKQEVVMKALGAYLGRVRGIDGASILADGTVTLVIDPEALQ